MPNYTYIDPATNEEVTYNMSISEMEAFEKKHPKFQRVIIPIALGDAIRMGIKKPPSDFDKYVLGKVREAHPKGSVEKRRTITKEF